MEGPLERECGQSLVFIALLLPVLVLFMYLLLDYAVATQRVQMVSAAADLGAHAGVQEVTVLPDGSLQPAKQAPVVAQRYFWRNIPATMRTDVAITTVRCGVTQHPRAGDMPYCRLVAQVKVGGFGLPSRTVSVQSVAYLPYGATREGQ